MNKKICKYCKKDNYSHSFSLFKKSNLGNDIFYTKISNAKMFNNPNSIIHHIEIELDNNNTNIWYWIIDFKNANTEHYFAFNTLIKLSKWIKYSNRTLNLKKIYINNSNILINKLIFLAKLYLPERIEVINTNNL